MAKDWIANDSLEDMIRDLVKRDPASGYHDAVWGLWLGITAAMSDQGVTQTELAQRTGLKQSYISRALARPENLTFRTAFRLCNALGLELVVKARPKAEAQTKDDPVERATRAPRTAEPQRRARKAVAAQPA